MSDSRLGHAATNTAKASSAKAKDTAKAKPPKSKQKRVDEYQPHRYGLIMPISAIDECTEAHWSEVRSILFDAIRLGGFEPNLVSDADEIGVIQKRIVQNVYDNPMIVCDVSGKNPNVMFELGLRLAFDKPTLIVKDDKTSYSFDTAPIEHLEYPRDLRFTAVVAFKAELAKRLEATHKKATTDPSYTTFLKHFGTFAVAKIEKREVTREELLREEMASLRTNLIEISAAVRQIARTPIDASTSLDRVYDPDRSREVHSAIARLLAKKSWNPEQLYRYKERIRLNVGRELSQRRVFLGEADFGRAFDVIFDTVVQERFPDGEPLTSDRDQGAAVDIGASKGTTR